MPHFILKSDKPRSLFRSSYSVPSPLGISTVHPARRFEYNASSIDAVEPTDADGPHDSVPIEETLFNSIAHQKECIDAKDHLPNRLDWNGIAYDRS